MCSVAYAFVTQYQYIERTSTQNLELTQDLVNAKLRMEQNTRDGHFLLAKARYAYSELVGFHRMFLYRHAKTSNPL